MAARRNDENFREAVLQAASKLIAARGYHAVRVSDIARACGTSTGSVHYYFAGKGDVLTEALKYSVERAFERQSAELGAIDDARERLLHLIEMQLPSGDPVRGEWSIWLQFWAEAVVRPELRQPHNELYARWRETIVRIVRRGQRQGTFRDLDPDEVTRHLTALTDGAAIQVMTGSPGTSVARMRRLLTDYVDQHLTARAGLRSEAVVP
jgi:AcrR family transcriptional regulator